MTDVAAPPPAAAVAVAHTRRSGAATPWRLLLRRPTFLVGMSLLLFWVVCAVFGTAIAPHNPYAQQLLAVNHGPSSAHWFGTDQIGRDVLSRVIVGARYILIVCPAATLLGTALGTMLGLIMGYLGGAVDAVVGRVIEAVLALPVVIVAFLFIVALGPSPVTLILVIGFIFTPLVGRTVRSAVLVEREREYVSAARLRGERGLYIMFAEILPNITAVVLVETTIRLAYAIFTAATLSFLGLGLQEPSPDWGLQIADGRNYLSVAWWVVMFPAFALATLVVGVNLLADGLKRVIEE
jgi:peptide/nickel transport system permease protein